MCGACRASSRIGGILRSGHLSADQEKVVTDLLRQTAGILSDLVEESQGHQVELEEDEQDKEGNKGHTSGPHSTTPEVVKSEKAEESESEYSTESSPKEKGEEIIEEKSEGKDSKEPRGGSAKPPEPDTPPPGWFEPRGTGAKPSGSGGRAAKVRADSHRGNRPLELKPASKASTKDQSKFREFPQVSSRDHRKESRRHDERRKRGREDNSEEAYLGVTRVPDPRAPLQRKRKAEKPRRRRRGSGGKQKRERAADFKAWREEKKRQRDNQ